MTTDNKCIFCKISTGDVPSEMLHEDEEIAIFKDIKPAAKHHYLAIPKMHLRNAKYLTTDQKSLSNFFLRPIVNVSDARMCFS